MNQPATSAQELLQGKRLTRVAVVEDDANVREMFRRMVGKIPGLGCVGAFVTGEEAVRELPGMLPDLVLMDIHLPGMNGIECMKQLRRLLPPVKVVMLTCERGHELLFTALRAGADGYATKPCERNTLARVIAETMSGEHPIASDMTGHLMQAVLNPPKLRLSPHPGLTSRENEVLGWVAQGLENKAIADRLGLSITTVHTHLQSIYRKLGVQNRVEALRVVTGL